MVGGRGGKEFRGEPVEDERRRSEEKRRPTAKKTETRRGRGQAPLGVVSRSTVRASARSRSSVLAAAVRAPGESAAHLDRVDVRQAPLRDVRARARERGEREQADDEMHARPRLLLQRLPLAEVREADLDGRGHVLPAGHFGGALLVSRDRAEAHTTGAAAKGSRSGGGGTGTPRARLWQGAEESRNVPVSCDEALL